MRLYKFMRAKFGMMALRERRLRISRIEELNDDFEFVGLALREKHERIALRVVRRQLNIDRGVICMSESWQNPLMWAHYADSYQGIVLGFDVDEGVFTKVQYINSRPTLEDFGITQLDEITKEIFHKLIILKAKGWSYEKERRAFVALTDADQINGTDHYFKPFGEIGVLREVIVGLRNREGREAVQAAVNDPAVDAFLTRGSFEEFKVVRQRDDTFWR